MNKLILIIFTLVINSCTIIEIINVPTKAKIDTINIIMQKDTTQKDTTKYPIGFDVTVEDWKDTINVN